MVERKFKSFKYPSVRGLRYGSRTLVVLKRPLTKRGESLFFEVLPEIPRLLVIALFVLLQVFFKVGKTPTLANHTKKKKNGEI